MDDYSNETVGDTADVEADTDDFWVDEESLQFSKVLAALWLDAPIDVVPGQPEPWVDKLADEIEIKTLVEMGVLQERCKYNGETGG